MSMVFEIPRLKACQACAFAKAKCEPDCGSTNCKRCNRHGIRCVLKESAPRKRRKKSPNDASAVAVATSHSGNRPELYSSVPSPYSILELECGFQHWKTSLSQFFPFVALDDVADACDFATKKPFLSIVLATLGCTKDRARQRALGNVGREYLAKHVIQGNEKSVDLIQGLLLMVHWYHLQFEMPTQRSIYLHLAMALVVDLELNKSPFSRGRLHKASEVEKGFELSFEDVRVHTLEEKRAFLGCLYLTSVISKCALNIDGARFSDYARTCCESLEDSPLPSDQYIIYLLELQQIVEMFELARSSLTKSHCMKGFVFEFQYNSFRGSKEFDVTAFVKYWDEQLNDYWAQVPTDARTMLLNAQYGYAKVCLWEVSLEESLFPSSLERSGLLQQCLESVRTIQQAFRPVSQDIELFFDLPSHLFAESNHSMFVAIQLRSVRCDNWSAQFVEQELQLVDAYETALRDLENMFATRPRNEIPDFFARLLPMASCICKWYKANAHPRPDQATESGDIRLELPSDELDFELLGQFFDFDDNLWLQNQLGSEIFGSASGFPA